MSNPITDLVELPVVPYVDINHAATAYWRVWYGKYQWPVLAIGIGIVLIVVLALFAFGFSEGWGWFAAASLGGYGVGIYCVIYSGGKHYFYTSIAQEWQWQYRPEVSPKTLHTTLLHTGHTHKFSDVLEGMWQNHGAHLGSFSYTIGYGKGSTTYSNALAKVDVEVDLPHILFAVKRDRFDDYIVDKARLVSVPLEGVLSHRGLYTQQKFEIEALQLFTPHVIEELEQKCPDYSFELVGAEVYVYGPSTLRSRAQIQDLFSLVQYIIGHILPRLQRMQGSVKAMHEAFGPKVKV